MVPDGKRAVQFMTTRILADGQRREARRLAATVVSIDVIAIGITTRISSASRRLRQASSVDAGVWIDS
jgi:hypothetical protein